MKEISSALGMYIKMYFLMYRAVKPFGRPLLSMSCYQAASEVKKRKSNNVSLKTLDPAKPLQSHLSVQLLFHSFSLTQPFSYPFNSPKVQAMFEVKCSC